MGGEKKKSLHRDGRGHITYLSSDRPGRVKRRKALALAISTVNSILKAENKKKIVNTSICESPSLYRKYGYVISVDRVVEMMGYSSSCLEKLRADGFLPGGFTRKLYTTEQAKFIISTFLGFYNPGEMDLSKYKADYLNELEKMPKDTYKERGRYVGRSEGSRSIDARKADGPRSGDK